MAGSESALSLKHGTHHEYAGSASTLSSRRHRRPTNTKFETHPDASLPQSAMVHDGSHRLQWRDLPFHVQREVEAAAGGAVISAVGQTGGYGPGMAARCELSDGRRVFVKAVSPAQNPDTPNMMRREAEINASLPAGAPAPALRQVLDDGEWVVLIFEDVEAGNPANPGLPRSCVKCPS